MSKSIETLENSKAYTELKSCSFLPSNHFNSMLLDVISDYIKKVETNTFPKANLTKRIKTCISADRVKLSQELVRLSKL